MFPGKFTRYVLWDVLKLFVLTLVAMTVVISLLFVGQKLVEEGLGYLAVIQLMPYVFLMALQFSVPATLLFSVCCVYGRISADNEIVALKGAGISPMCIFRPVWALGFLVSIPSVLLNDLAVSWGEPEMQRVVLRSLAEVVNSVLKAHGSYSNDKGFTIHVQDVEDRWLIKPNIWMLNNGKLQSISAERARISPSSKSDQLVIELENSYIDINGETQIIDRRLDQIEMPIDFVARKGSDKARASRLSIRQIPDEIQVQLDANARQREELAAYHSIALVNGRFSQIDGNDVSSKLYGLDFNEKRLAKLRTEPMRRWSLGFSCLAFVWMGVPMAVLIRSADYWWTFGVCFIPVLLVYYPIFGLSLEFAKDGRWPAVSLWLGNLTLALVGTWMMMKVVRN
jgi:lipopolysaccharide export system permease protein